jgi:primosomal protein N''
MKMYANLYLTEFFSELKMFLTRIVEEVKTHILCSVIFFSENLAFYEIMWKMWYSQTGHRWQCNITQKICDLHAR